MRGLLHLSLPLWPFVAPHFAAVLADAHERLALTDR